MDRGNGSAFDMGGLPDPPNALRIRDRAHVRLSALPAAGRHRTQAFPQNTHAGPGADVSAGAGHSGRLHLIYRQQCGRSGDSTGRANLPARFHEAGARLANARRARRRPGGRALRRNTGDAAKAQSARAFGIEQPDLRCDRTDPELLHSQGRPRDSGQLPRSVHSRPRIGAGDARRRPHAAAAVYAGAVVSLPRDADRVQYRPQRARRKLPDSAGGDSFSP